MGDHLMKAIVAVVLMLVFLTPASHADDAGTLDRQLSDAAERGDPSTVKALIAAGADPDAKVNVFTALHVAIRISSVEVVNALLAAGADPNSRVDGYPALQIAVMEGSVEIVKALLAAGADVNAFGEWVPGCCQHRDTALHQAVKYCINPDLGSPCSERRTGIIHVLLAAGAYVNARDKLDGWTPLDVANRWEIPNVIHILLRAGAVPNAR